MLQQTLQQVFTQLSGTLSMISQDQYIHPSRVLSNATIGQHVRHIIELFQCLETGYESGIVNYEKRKRDSQIEQQKAMAEQLIAGIYNQLGRPNKDLILEGCYDGPVSETLHIHTNYDRELAYNLEHTIHHMALIRIGIEEVAQLALPEAFGVAPSTIKHRKECAQ
ncbi:MAG: DinB family protein [Terrimonas sp.]|nr:DinB family protein [Terrimonas sp.]